jgi:geranylgeranyl diphosphate synthase type I
MLQTLSTHRPAIENFIKKFLSEQKQKFSNHFWAEDYFTRLEKYMLGGKMIRGGLVIALHEIFSENEKLTGRKKMPLAVIKTAAAMELMQAALLMHDDILDQDELRRGSPTMHIQYKNWAEKNNPSDSKHFGTGITICGGDVALGLCFSLLASLNIDEKIKNQLQAVFSQELICVALAEAHDFEMAFTKREVSKDEILDMYRNKTGRYSLSLPMMAGVVLAGKSRDSETIKTIEKIGENLGIIFQIKDDEISIFGDEKETGKPAGNDIREGKKTLFWYYLGKMKDENKELEDVLKFFGKSDLTSEEIKNVRETLKESDIMEKINNDVQELAHNTRNFIKKLNLLEKQQDFFTRLVKFSAERKK